MSKPETNGLHEVVQLLVARMASHPEEFRYAGRAADVPEPVYAQYDAATTARGHRWNSLLNELDYFTSEAEEEALRAGLRVIHLNRLHEQVMDELLNGEERRQKEHEAELAKQLAYAQRIAQAQAQQAGVYTVGMGGGALGQATTSIAGQKYTHVPVGNSVSISDLMDAKMDALGKQLQNTHDNSLFNAMKKLGLKK